MNFYIKILYYKKNDNIYIYELEECEGKNKKRKSTLGKFNVAIKENYRKANAVVIKNNINAFLFFFFVLNGRYLKFLYG